MLRKLTLLSIATALVMLVPLAAAPQAWANVTYTIQVFGWDNDAEEWIYLGNWGVVFTFPPPDGEFERTTNLSAGIAQVTLDDWASANWLAEVWCPFGTIFADPGRLQQIGGGQGQWIGVEVSATVNYKAFYYVPENGR
ncbi:MAG: hypothetical protein FJY67_11700 [Calditrichaeota bacterium]|nr:hypothetical protein [Calditrichota bacterium]